MTKPIDDFKKTADTLLSREDWAAKELKTGKGIIQLGVLSVKYTAVSSPGQTLKAVLTAAGWQETDGSYTTPNTPGIWYSFWKAV